MVWGTFMDFQQKSRGRVLSFLLFYVFITEPQMMDMRWNSVTHSGHDRVTTWQKRPSHFFLLDQWFLKPYSYAHKVGFCYLYWVETFSEFYVMCIHELFVQGSKILDSEEVAGEIAKIVCQPWKSLHKGREERKWPYYWISIKSECDACCRQSTKRLEN